MSIEFRTIKKLGQQRWYFYAVLLCKIYSGNSRKNWHTRPL